jgi:hypothetical protein
MFYLRSVRLYLQFFVGGLMFYLRSVRLYLQLFVMKGQSNMDNPEKLAT